MKLQRFTYDATWINGHLVTLAQEGNLEVSMSNFQPSPELLDMIEREAEAEINRRRQEAIAAKYPVDESHA